MRGPARLMPFSRSKRDSLGLCANTAVDFLVSISYRVAYRMLRYALAHAAKFELEHSSKKIKNRQSLELNLRST